MQMWQDLEEAAGAAPSRRPRSGQRRRHQGGAAAGAGPSGAPFGGLGLPPGALLPPPAAFGGLPPSLLFGGFGGGHGGGFGGGGFGGGPRGAGGGRGAGGTAAANPLGQLMALREAVAGMQRTGLPPQLLFSDRDFTADDYDLLCRLDETVERRGAGAAQLAALPTQVAPAGGLAGGDGGGRQRCSVCLEAFEEGEQLCALPCAHRFHAACVKTWLARKNACPICQRGL